METDLISGGILLPTVTSIFALFSIAWFYSLVKSYMAKSADLPDAKYLETGKQILVYFI
jgi:hypothetical protein